MLGMPALIIVVRESLLRDHRNTPELILRPSLDIIVQGQFLRHNTHHLVFERPPPFADRRYIFIEQVGCIPSISPSLFPLVGVLIWPLLFNVASLVYLGIFS